MVFISNSSVLLSFSLTIAFKPTIIDNSAQLNIFLKRKSLLIVLFFYVKFNFVYISYNF